MAVTAHLPITVETRRTLAEHDRRWPIKLGMRAVATVFAFIAFFLFAIATGLSIKNYGGNDWVDGLPLAPVMLALIYNSVVLFLSLIHRQGRPIHPGWHVGVDLIIWALAVPSIVFSVGLGWFWWWQPVYLEINDMVPCDIFNQWSQQCQPLIYTLGKMEIAANVFLALILIMHFILFVFACIATHRWRRANKRAAAERNDVELQYHRSPEEHMAQQPSPPPAYTPSTGGSTRAASANQADDPFKDPAGPGHVNEDENPFKDAERDTVKYA